MNGVNLILAVFALLISIWAWATANQARAGVAKVLRLLNARVGKLVDEAEGKKPPAAPDRGFPQPLPFPPAPRAVEETAPRADGGEPPAAPQPGRAAPSPRPSRNRGYPTPEVDTLPPPPTSDRSGGKRPSEATRDLAVRAKEILAKHGDVASVDLRNELGLTIKSFAKVRALLNADPDVVTYGQTKSRRYKLRDGAPTNGRRQQIAAEASGDGRAPKLPTTPGPKGAPKQEPTLDGRIMSVLQLLPKSAPDLAVELGASRVDVLSALARLKAEGDVRRHDSGNWVAVP